MKRHWMLLLAVLLSGGCLGRMDDSAYHYEPLFLPDRPNVHHEYRSLYVPPPTPVYQPPAPEPEAPIRWRYRPAYNPYAPGEPLQLNPSRRWPQERPGPGTPLLR